jgi:hypothetical protein
MVVFNTYTPYDGVADDSSAINWINNGLFMFYDQSLAVVEDTGLTRCGADKNAITPTKVTREFDVLDPTFYKKTTFSFKIAENGHQELISGWKFSGNGVVTVNPVENGTIVPSFDGGNLLVINGTQSGTITMDQEIEYFYPLLGSEITLALGGRKVAGLVKVELQLLVDDAVVHQISTQSQFFGSYRRFSSYGKCPKTGKTAKIRIKLTGSGFWSVGLSGITLLMGAMTSYTAVPSLTDLLIPKGTTFLTLGDACPSGYQEIATDHMALVTSGPANFLQQTTDALGVTRFELETEGGHDVHDHNPDGQIDALDEPSGDRHVGPVSVPDDGYALIHGVPYHLTGTVTSWFPHDRPTVTLSVDHSHSLTSEMAAVPPNFRVKYCKKL